MKASSSLPPVPDYLKHKGHGGRPGRPDPGDADKTLAAWTTFNKATVEFDQEKGEGQQEERGGPAARPRSAGKANIRNGKLAAAYKLYAKAYSDSPAR